MTGSWYTAQFHPEASTAHPAATAASKRSALGAGSCSRRRLVPLQWFCSFGWSACQLPRSPAPPLQIPWSDPATAPKAAWAWGWLVPRCSQKRGVRDCALTWTLPGRWVFDKTPAAAGDKARPLPPWDHKSSLLAQWPLVLPDPHTAAFPSLTPS